MDFVTTNSFTMVDMLVAIVGFIFIGWVGRMVYDEYREMQ